MDPSRYRSRDLWAQPGLYQRHTNRQPANARAPSLSSNVAFGGRSNADIVSGNDRGAGSDIGLDLRLDRDRHLVAGSSSSSTRHSPGFRRRFGDRLGSNADVMAG